MEQHRIFINTRRDAILIPEILDIVEAILSDVTSLRAKGFTNPVPCFDFLLQRLPIMPFRVTVIEEGNDDPTVNRGSEPDASDLLKRRLHVKGTIG